MTRHFPALALAVFGVATSLSGADGKTRNVIFVMTDGLRWQEVFQGADAALLNKEHGGVANVEELRREFWRNTPEARREVLLPFLWSEIARKGQIFGNRERGSDAYLTNGLNFSYPGYSETLCGFADPRINSNDKVPNPNVTVLEWLHRKPAFAGKIAGFGAWDTFPAILNADRAGFPVNAGYDPLTIAPVPPSLALLNRLKKEIRYWEGEPFDALTFHTAIEYFKQHKPRILFLSLGETDEWAHGGRYDLYLTAAQRFDLYVRELWETAQSIPEYRDATTLILAVDHGRGLAPVDWKSHGQRLPETKFTWMAFLGPDTAAKGERSKTPPVTQDQIAATLAALLGEDYATAVPRAGKPIAEVLAQ
jgi:hypothetical protein